MAVTVISRPDDFASAYKPIEYTFTSSFAGYSGTLNTVGDNNGFAKFNITISGVTDISTIMLTGGIITISNAGVYNGDHTILLAESNGRVLVDTIYISNDSGNAGYSHKGANVVCDLYVNGAFTVRKTMFEDANGQFIFNFERAVQSSIGNNLKPMPLSVDTSTANSESSKSIHVVYADSYIVEDGGSLIQLSGLPAFANSLIDDSANSITVVNSTVPILEWDLGSTRSELTSIDGGLSSFVVTSSVGARFLTNSPKTIRIGRNESYQLSAIIENDFNIEYNKQIKGYDSAGNLLGTVTKTFLPVADSVFDLSCGPRDLGTGTIVSSVARYTILIRAPFLNGGNGLSISETITFVIDDKCSGAKTRFVWLNPRGGYDAYTFTSPRKLNSSVSKGLYTSTRSFPTDISDREDSIISVNAKDSISVSTNKVDRITAEWLQELLESPQVFIELEEGNPLHETRIPVTLINKTRSISDTYNGLFNISIRYRFGFSKPSIRPY